MPTIKIIFLSSLLVFGRVNITFFYASWRLHEAGRLKFETFTFFINLYYLVWFLRVNPNYKIWFEMQDTYFVKV